MLVVSVLYDWIQVTWSHHSSLHSISWSTRLQNSPVSYAACNRCKLLLLFVNMKYSATQMGFTSEIYIGKKSCKKCHGKLRSWFPGVSFPSKSALYQTNKFQTGSLLMKKWEQTQCFLSEEILCNTGNPLEISPQEVMKMAITETSLSTWHVQTPIKLLCLNPYNFTVLQKLQEADYAASVWFCNWFCEAVCTDEVMPLLTYCTH
jgi:hypothetical protein